MNHLRSRSSGCRLAFAVILGMSLTAGATVSHCAPAPLGRDSNDGLSPVSKMGCHEYRPDPGLKLLVK